MPKDVKRSIMQLRATALVVLALASAIAAAAFFAAPADASESASNPQLTETTYEAHQVSEESGSDAAGEHRSPDTGQDRHHAGDPKYCYITVAFGDEQPEIHPSNTIKIDGDLCTEIGLYIYAHHYEKAMKGLE